MCRDGEGDAHLYLFNSTWFVGDGVLDVPFEAHFINTSSTAIAVPLLPLEKAFIHLIHRIKPSLCKGGCQAKLDGRIVYNVIRCRITFQVCLGKHFKSQSDI